MTAIEALREEVKHYIDHADDKSLRMVKAILKIKMEDENAGEDEDWDNLPKELQQSINAAIKEGDEGNIIPHKEIVKKYSKWFRK